MKSEALRRAIDEKKSIEMSSRFLSPNQTAKTKKSTQRRPPSQMSERKLNDDWAGQMQVLGTPRMQEACEIPQQETMPINLFV
jgi:hypothetical protein